MITEDKKVEILLAALDERYKAIHAIRDRVQNVGLWSLGLLLGAGGWIIQSDLRLTCFEKAVYLVGAILAFLVLRFSYLEDLERGFQRQQKATVRIEKALKLYETNFFDDSENSIYPPEWEHAGTEKGAGKFFNTTFYLLYIGFAFLAIAILSVKVFYPFYFPLHI